MKKAIMVLLFLFMASPVFAGKIGLQWDSNTESDLATGEKARYKIYYRIGQSLTGNKANASVVIPVRVIDDENAGATYVEKTITGLDESKRYYFVVTALDEAGNESALSNEVNGSPTDETAPVKPNLRIILQKILNALKGLLGGLQIG